MTWASSATSSAPSTATATDSQSVVISRSTRGVEQGLWGLRVGLTQAGSLVRRLEKPVDAGGFDTFTVDLAHDGGRGKAGAATGAGFVEDSRGVRYTGDFYPITGKLGTVGVDLQGASRAGVDVSQIAVIGVSLRLDAKTVMLEVQTDDWSLRSSQRTYWPLQTGQGNAGGAPAKGFFAYRQGGQLHVGQAEQWRMTFHKRAGHERAWIEVARGKNGQMVIGQPGTGLMVLDQEGWNGIEKAVQRGPVRAESVAASRGAGGMGPTHAWPGMAGDFTTWDWRVAWTSPVAVQVDVKQVAGRFDEMGRPALTVNWKFTIYRSGQVYVHAEWEKEGASEVVDPVTWALVMDRGVVDDLRKSPERLLTELYPAEYRAETMPHQMQVGNPVAMLARSGAGEANLWWWADVGGKRMFGVGMPAATRAKGPADCLLLVNDLLENDKNMLGMAATFSQYLSPATVKFSTGSLDRDFPGDRDNDGMVEQYGFQVVRLANGRAVFRINPGERPLVAPSFLLTVPPGEREKVDLKHSHVLVNVDGKQDVDPPQWPDGSFLWQYPGMLVRPVVVEVTLVNAER